MKGLKGKCTVLKNKTGAGMLKIKDSQGCSKVGVGELGAER